LLAAAGLFASGVALPSAAQAADLGGDCCADLEERVAELEATTARKGNRRVSLTISGQVQTSIMAWDAGGRFGGIDGKAAVPNGTADVVTNVGAPSFPAADPAIAPDALPLKCSNAGIGGAPNAGNAALIGCADPAHINPPHVHADHTHALTKTTVLTSIGSAAVPARKAGRASDVYIVDNVTGGTFFQFAGNARVNPDVTAGFILVMAINSGARTHQVSQLSDDAPDALGAPDSTFVMTQGAWYIDSKQLGRVTVGRTNTATAGLTVIDLSGANVIANSNFGFWNAGFIVNNASSAAGIRTWSDLLGGATVWGSATARANAVMYSSPVFGGFSLQAAWGENDIWDAALRYAGEFAGFRVAAGIGYANNYSGTNEVILDIPANGAFDGPSVWKGSASILHVATGLFGNVAYVSQANNQISSGANDDTTLLYLQGGIAKNWTGLGNTVLYGEWAEVRDAIKGTASTTLPFDGSAPDVNGVNLGDANMWGLGIVQNVDAAAMSMFLSYRNYTADFNSSDMNIVMGGARIQF
jgi:hypothetical protein